MSRRLVAASVTGGSVDEAKAGRSTPARERLVDAAYELFSAHGTRAVGVAQIIAESGVARMTLYRHFSSKDALVVEFLHRHGETWTRGWLRPEVERRASDPGERLMAVFDVLREWFQSDSYPCCPFIRAMLEHTDAAGSVRGAALGHLAAVREMLGELGAGARVSDPDELARRWHILMTGSMVAAAAGDRGAAGRAREIGALVLEHERSRVCSS